MTTRTSEKKCLSRDARRHRIALVVVGDHISVPVKHCRQCVFADFARSARRSSPKLGACVHPHASRVKSIRPTGLHRKCSLLIGPTIVHVDSRDSDALQFRPGQLPGGRVSDPREARA